jgi:hypothetical protein
LGKLLGKENMTVPMILCILNAQSVMRSMSVSQTEAFEHFARRRTVAFVLMGLTRSLSITKHLVGTIGSDYNGVEYSRAAKNQGILRHIRLTITPAAESLALPVVRGQ